MSNKKGWLRNIGIVTDIEASMENGSPVDRMSEEWNLTNRDKSARITRDLAQQLWPDFQLNAVRDDFFYVTNFRLKNLGSTQHITATVDLRRAATGRPDDPNPIRRDLTWSMKTEYIEVPGGYDSDGNLITNTAHDPIAGLVDYEPIFIWEKTRYITKTPAWLPEFAYKCTNSTRVVLDGFVCEPFTLKLEGLELSPVEYTLVNNKEIAYRALPLKFAWKRGTWYEEFLNQGFNEYFPPQDLDIFFRYTTPGRKERIVDAKGNPVEKPVPLTKEGQRFRERIPRPTTENPQAYEIVIKDVLDRKELHTFKRLRLRKLDFNLLLK